MSIQSQSFRERMVMADPEWIAGSAWGKPRPGHPEGSVAAHVSEVLTNVDDVAVDEEDRDKLRFVALVHDHFKYQVDRSRDRTGENHHGMLARRFAERYTDDTAILDVIELHDEAFNAWKAGDRTGNWSKAEARADKLIERLAGNLAFYLRFFDADNRTGDKTTDPIDWVRAYANTFALHEALLRTVETWPARLGPLPEWVNVWYRSAGRPSILPAPTCACGHQHEMEVGCGFCSCDLWTRPKMLVGKYPKNPDDKPTVALHD